MEKYFYNKEIEIEIVIQGDFDNFREFSDVFYFFTKFDNIYNSFQTGDHHRNAYYTKRPPKTQLVSVTKGSLVIGAFIEQHWLELLLFFISVNLTDVRKNVKTNLSLIDEIIIKVEDTLKEKAEDFLELEKEKMLDILRQFDRLSDDVKQIYLNHINRSKKILNKIKRIRRK